MRMNSMGSAMPRSDRMTRANRAIALDRQGIVHSLAGSFFRAFEATATVLILILISDAILPLFLHTGPLDLVTTPTTPAERAAYWLAYAFIAFQVVLHPMQLLRTATRNPFVLAVAAIAALSVTWSIAPDVSLRRAFSLGMWTLFGTYLASRYTTTELLRLLGVALSVIAILSLATAVIIPDYGRETGFDNGAWRGVFTTKNALGEIMLLAAVVFGLFATRGGRIRILAIIGVITAVVLIFFAKATAALLIVGVLTITIPVVLTFRRNNAAAALVLSCLLGVSAAASIAIAERDAVLSVLGKDATLTGRTVLWAAVAQRIQDRPVLGYGYSAFWEAGTEAERLRTAVGWDTPHSHNGLLDEWLDLGLIGVLALLAAYLRALRRAWLSLRTSVDLDGMWAMTFLVMLFLGNTTESSIAKSFLIWVIFVTVACMRWAPTPNSERRPAYVTARGRWRARR
jgi:exopolysaccharide production protein ExoQ